MKFRKFFILGVFLSATINAHSAPEVSEHLNSLNISIVDVQKVIENSIALKQAFSEFEKKEKAAEQEFSALNKELEQENNRLSSLQASLSEKTFSEKKKIFEQKVANFHKKVQERREQIQHASQSAMSALHAKVQEILKKIGKEQKFLLIFERPAVPWNSEEIKDLTPEVLSILNDELPTIKIKF